MHTFDIVLIAFLYAPMCRRRSTLQFRTHASAKATSTGGRFHVITEHDVAADTERCQLLLTFAAACLVWRRPPALTAEMIQHGDDDCRLDR